MATALIHAIICTALMDFLDLKYLHAKNKGSLMIGGSFRLKDIIWKD